MSAKEIADELVSATLNGLDWDNLDDVRSRAGNLFEALLRPAGPLLRELLHGLPDRPELHPLCARMNFLSKLVVWQSQDQSVRLRVHHLNPDFTDAPHNHRFTFAARILSGAYLHHVYPDDTMEPPDPIADASVRLTRVESAGSSYVLHHETIHATYPTEPTVSVVLRGPVVKRSGKVVDQSSSRTVGWVGAEEEPAGQLRKKHMSASDIERLVDLVGKSVWRDVKPGMRGVPGS